jgi:hypothetical protein
MQHLGQTMPDSVEVTDGVLPHLPAIESILERYARQHLQNTRMAVTNEVSAACRRGTVGERGMLHLQAEVVARVVYDMRQLVAREPLSQQHTAVQPQQQQKRQQQQQQQRRRRRRRRGGGGDASPHAPAVAPHAPSSAAAELAAAAASPSAGGGAMTETASPRRSQEDLLRQLQQQQLQQRMRADRGTSPRGAAPAPASPAPVLAQARPSHKRRLPKLFSVNEALADGEEEDVDNGSDGGAETSPKLRPFAAAASPGSTHEGDTGRGLKKVPGGRLARLKRQQAEKEQQQQEEQEQGLQLWRQQRGHDAAADADPGARGPAKRVCRAAPPADVVEIDLTE